MGVLPVMTKEKFIKFKRERENPVPDGAGLIPIQNRWMRVEKDGEIVIFEPLRVRRINIDVTNNTIQLFLDGSVELKLPKDENIINDLSQRLSVPPEYFSK